jgi:hypothetical protein
MKKDSQRTAQSNTYAVKTTCLQFHVVPSNTETIETAASPSRRSAGNKKLRNKTSAKVKPPIALLPHAGDAEEKLHREGSEDRRGEVGEEGARGDIGSSEECSYDGSEECHFEDDIIRAGFRDVFPGLTVYHVVVVPGRCVFRVFRSPGRAHYTKIFNHGQKPVENKADTSLWLLRGPRGGRREDEVQKRLLKLAVWIG